MSDKNKRIVRFASICIFIIIVVFAYIGSKYYQFKTNDVCYFDSHCVLDICSGAIHINYNEMPGLPCRAYAEDVSGLKYEAKCVYNKCKTVRNYDQLLQKATEIGEVRIIVQIEANSSLTKEESEKEAIGIKTKIIADVESLGATSIKHFQNPYMFAAAVNPEALQYLTSHPDIQSISEDNLDFPSDIN